MSSTVLTAEDRLKQLSLNVPKKGKVYAYCRCSTQKQKDEGYSIEVQDEQVKKAAIEKGLDEPIIFTDAAKSGTSTVKRDNFNALMGIVKPGDTIITLDMSRVSRSMKDCANFHTILEEKKVDIIYIREKWHLTYSKGDIDPMTKLVMTVFSYMNQLESQRCSERTKMVLDSLKQSGTLRTKARVGYSWGTNDKGEKVLVQVPEEQKLINYIFECYIKDPKLSYVAVSKLVNQEMAIGNLVYRNLKTIAPAQIRRIVLDNGLKEVTDKQNSEAIKNKTYSRDNKLEPKVAPTPKEAPKLPTNPIAVPKKMGYMPPRLLTQSTALPQEDDDDDYDDIDDDYYDEEQ